ncbi:uncharacterized protein LOC130992984 [Salvia miltiorrhiza]|uniref:uncharacterized protein LOC130992984 n=1 Tax=Salvia miltiorrhiza TaxID=226208 RepID=UPI0025AD0D17|nr:uncharacterized protein LOC130992984 [Salvia miltiorrhiza]
MQYSEHSSRFNVGLTTELAMYKGRHLHLLDMIFFPVADKGMYFALCFDTKRGKLFVLDSMVDVDEDGRMKEYERVSSLMRQLLVDYLNHAGEENRAKKAGKTKLHVVKLKWADGINKEDTGIYMMRHLETFMGDYGASWKCISVVSRAKQLHVLRVRYGSTLVGWEQNKNGVAVKSEASEYYVTISQVENFNANIMLIGS